jgi:hypothetical protein
MRNRILNIFFLCSGVFLLITGVAKLVSADGNARILQNIDPILNLRFQEIFWIVGGLECGLAFICFLNKQILLRALLIASLASSFLVYRFGLWWVDYHRPCPCLGNLTDALHISPQIANTAMKIILAYLLIGSYGTLLWLWRQKSWATATTVSPV